MLSPPPPPPVPGLSPSLQYSQWSLFFSPYFALFFFRLLMAPTIITIFLFSRHIYPYFWHFYPAFPKKNPPPPEEETKREGVFQHTHTHTQDVRDGGGGGGFAMDVYFYMTIFRAVVISPNKKVHGMLYIYIYRQPLCVHTIWQPWSHFRSNRGKGGD